MGGIRHLTASAVVFDGTRAAVLLVHHHKLGRWIYPGGHLDPDEDPAQAALREVREETGVLAEVVTDPLVHYDGVTAHAAPYAILEMAVNDARVGPHHHIDLLYVCRAVGGDLAAQLDEVAGVRWVPLDDLASFDTPAEVPAVVARAAAWAADRW